MRPLNEILKSEIYSESDLSDSGEEIKNFVIDLLIDIAGPGGMNEEGEFFNPAFNVITEMVEVLNDDQLNTMLAIVDEYFETGIFDDDESDNKEIEVPTELVGQEIEQDDEMDEGIMTQKERRMRAIKKKKKAILGKKATTLNFKRNFYFDRSKRKFVKRDNALSVTTLRKKAKRIKKIARRGSTKAKVQRTKKRLSHMAKINV